MNQKELNFYSSNVLLSEGKDVLRIEVKDNGSAKTQVSVDVSKEELKEFVADLFEVAYGTRNVLPSAFQRILPFLYSFNATHPVHSCHRRLVFQTQRWTAALDSVALKCISYKILPFCERVIFRKKRRKSLIRQSL